MAKRNYIFDTIKQVFLLYGFQQIETPALENLSTLMGKYGEEGDKLLFKILNSGDFLKDAPDELLQGRDSLHLTNKISEKGLRYDLTVPFARFVVQHRADLQMPFKRYQIQPVWRADRPQRGRYREFYQCDADVVGSDSLLNEVELVSMIDDVFARLGIHIVVKLNNRKILSGIAEVIGAPDKIVDITVAIDKMEKIGLDNVNAELREKGLTDEAVATLQPLLTLDGANSEKLDSLRQMLQGSEVGQKGLDEMANNAERGRTEISNALENGLKVSHENKPLSLLPQIWTDYKKDELKNIYNGKGTQKEKERIYDMLMSINASQSNTWDDIRK